MEGRGKGEEGRRALLAWADPHVNQEEWQEMEILRQTILLLFRAWEDVAHQHGLEIQQYLALWALHSASWDPMYSPPTVTTLAHKMVRGVNTTVEILDRLEAKGMVYRSEDTVDARRKYVHLTEAGRNIVEQAALSQRRVIFSMGPPLIQTLEVLLTRRFADEGERKREEEEENEDEDRQA